MLVSSLVIFFPVVRGGRTVCDCGEFVVFGGFLVRVVWHSVSNPFSPLQLRILQFSKLFNYEHSPRAGLCRFEPKITLTISPDLSQKFFTGIQ
jgi:hypothetical protein